MKLEIYNGDFVGTAEWRGPGDVALEVEDPRQREFFAAYFAGEDAYLDGPVECAEMEHSRRDSSEQAFGHAAYRLAAYAYTMRSADGRPRPR
jgi:hypothetical protein